MPTPLRASFLTHHSYIEAIRHAIELLADTPPNYLDLDWDPSIPKMNLRLAEALASRVRSSNGYKNLSPKALPDSRRLVANLRNAWSTESLMYVTGRHLPAEGLGTATNWTVVQAYYAVYLVSKATAIAQARTGALDSHPLVQKFFIDFWAEGDRRDLHPWSIVHGHDGTRNVPADAVIQSERHTWSSARREECWARVATAWQSTRRDQVEAALRIERERKARQRRKAWDEANTIRVSNGQKPRRNAPPLTTTLNAEEKSRVNRSQRPVSLLDYLYRLRIRSNYEDSAMWSEGPEDTEESLRVHWNLTTITSATLLAHEVLLRRILGSSLFDGMMDDWLVRNGAMLEASEGLKLRAEPLRRL